MSEVRLEMGRVRLKLERLCCRLGMSRFFPWAFFKNDGQGFGADV